jgi:hypothetical protein
LKFYIVERKLKNPNISFVIDIKDFKSPQKWEKYFLKKQISIPWRPAGKCTVSSDKVNFEWNDYMKALFTKEIKTSHWLK